MQSSQAVSNAKRLGWPLTEVEEAVYRTEAPGGYPFYLVDREQPSRGEYGPGFCLRQHLWTVTGWLIIGFEDNLELNPPITFNINIISLKCFTMSISDQEIIAETINLLSRTLHGCYSGNGSQFCTNT